MSNLAVKAKPDVRPGECVIAVKTADGMRVMSGIIDEWSIEYGDWSAGTYNGTTVTLHFVENVLEEMVGA